MLFQVCASRYFHSFGVPNTRVFRDNTVVVIPSASIFVRVVIAQRIVLRNSVADIG